MRGLKIMIMIGEVRAISTQIGDLLIQITKEVRPITEEQYEDDNDYTLNTV